MTQWKCISLIALMLVLLAACKSTPVVPPTAVANREADAEAAFARGDFVTARDLYRMLAERATGDTASHFRIEQARAELALGEAQTALGLLDALTGPMPTPLDAAAAGIRGDALFALGRAVDAVRVLVNREIWLDSSDAVLENQAKILDGLALPQNRSAATLATGDPTIDGWLALAPLAGMTAGGDEFMAALIDWQSRFPRHEAAAGILAERLSALRPRGAVPAHIALLLPLGNNAVRAQAEAIRDGIVADYFASGHADQTTLTVYDTAQRGSLASYEAAQLEGADFIIGPLLQSSVDTVQPQVGFVGTLALNVSAQPALNFFQFALSSDDEIEAIATRAIAAGDETAAVLYGSDADGYGYSLMTRFRQAFESRGGQVVNWSSYVPDGQDLAPPIENLLNVTQSDQREARLRRDIGRSIEFEPRRREDIDMIFIQADDRDARLLMPLLKTYHADDIPTYATRDVYDPTRNAPDSDLNGLIFPDLPLVVRPVGDAATAAEALAAYTSESAARNVRFFAFGFDAYRLAELLYSGDTAGWPVEGATGELYLGDDGRIRRVLPFAQFEDGRPRPADATPALSGPR